MSTGTKQSGNVRIHRVVVGLKKHRKNNPPVYKIYNLEMEGPRPSDRLLQEIFCDPVKHQLVKQMPQQRQFLEHMYHGGVVDPAQESIKIACQAKGIKIIAAKISTRYYGKAAANIFVNPQVEVAYRTESDIKKIETLLPRGKRLEMQFFNLLAMDDSQLLKLSKDRDLSLSLADMKMLANFQAEQRLSVVSDTFLEYYGCRWSDHCKHRKWAALGIYKYLYDATMLINNPNMVSAFKDNAGGWRFYGGKVVAFKKETHNSPSQKEPFGGQLTKLGGVIRDLFGFGLGAKPIGNTELTVVGEFDHKKFPFLEGNVLEPQTIAQETIRAIAGYGNPMGIPMLLSRMLSHPNFGGKVFALGGTIGITTLKRALKGKSLPGDIAILAGGRTGNDGIHGATISSGEMTEKVDTGDSCHVQIGNPYTEQLFMRAIAALYRAGCLRAINDFGAAGIVSAFGEMGEDCGLLINLAKVPLKCAGLSNWQIFISESQERMAFAIKPEKVKTALAIFRRFSIEATPIGIFTNTQRFQVIYDQESEDFERGMSLSGEVCLDELFSNSDRCPAIKLEVVDIPKTGIKTAHHPDVDTDDVEELAAKIVAHFDVCNQAAATMQYDSTVQSIHYQGPLYGRNYNVASSLSVQRPVYNKQWGLTHSESFSPWQFEADPVQAAINAMVHAIVTQLVAGVKLRDICLADNFYTPHLDPHAWGYLKKQVYAIADLSVKLGTPFITGKDSSSGSATFDNAKHVINVLCSVVISAMGKIPDVRRLVLHLWQEPGNVLMMVGPRAKTLNGSILASVQGVNGNFLEGLSVEEAAEWLPRISKLARSGMVKSAVPINEGGAILRLFEGVEASGFGIDMDVDPNLLFTANLGGALVEVNYSEADTLKRKFRDLQPIVIGRIKENQEMVINGKPIDFHLLQNGWNTTFERKVYNK